MIKILFFIGGLVSGGKERRFLELLTYLKSKGNYEMLVVTTTENNHFPQFHQLGIPLTTIKKNKWLKTASIPLAFYKICKEFNPNLVHTWGRMQTFYVLPTTTALRIPLINGQITNAVPHIALANRIIDKINFKSSDIILSNSHAGIDSYHPPINKSSVIYNGMNMNRFKDLATKSDVKKKYNIETEFAVVMVATFSKNKDYERFFSIAAHVLKKRDDVTFIGVGYYHRDSSLYQKCLKIIEGNNKLIMTGVINDVEAVVNACDIGVLLSNTKVHGEGISNAILEYMALGKAVIANDAGGTKELLKNNINGYLVHNESDAAIADMLTSLLDDEAKRNQLGKEGKMLIENNFTIKTMGDQFVKLYENVSNFSPSIAKSKSDLNPERR